MKRLRATLVAGLAAIMWCTATAAAAQTKIALGYTGANAFVPAFVAKEQGFFAKQGLDVSLQLIPVGSTMPGALVSGSLNVATLTAPVLLLAKEGGLDLGIVSAASFQSRQRTTAGAVARPGLVLKTAADFRGRKVGVPGLNSVQHLLFMKWLDNNGVKPSQVTYIEAAFPQMGDMLKSGVLDAALIVEPFLGRVQQSGSGTLAVSYGPQVSERYLEAFYVMDKSFVEKNPKAPAAFKAAIAQAVAWTQANDAEARKTMVKYLKLPEAVAESMPMPEFSADFSDADVTSWVDMARQFGLIKSAMSAASLTFH